MEKKVPSFLGVIHSQMAEGELRLMDEGIGDMGDVDQLPVVVEEEEVMKAAGDVCHHCQKCSENPQNFVSTTAAAAVEDRYEADLDSQRPGHQ